MLISVSENVVTKTNPGGPMKLSYRTVSLTILLVVFAFTQSVFAQVSIGGTPYSFENSAKSSIAKVTMPGVNVNALMAEDKLEEGKDIPYRFGHPFDVNYNLKNSGTWETLENGDRLWRLHIKSGNAYSINLIYSDFYLPTGARLYVYSADKAMVLGGFTHLNNKEHSQFATAPVKGSESIVEYYEPKHAFGQGRIQISRIVHGYRDVFYKVEKGFGDSGPCNINVNCEDGDDWQDEKRAVAMILTGGGFRLCSGVMVNNVEQDLTPYFLTANHCLGGEETWIVMFNYESPGCENEDGPTSQTVQGTTLLASNSDSDFALLLLSETPPAEYNIHYAGWSALDVADATSVGIHHPSGDIKKISFDYDPYVSSDYTPSPYLADSHWEVTDWDDGTTEGGSSGSPLFDSNQRIVGQLHGGWAACGNDLQDYYGKFSMSWDRGPSASSRLRDWLDPNNTGTLILNGRDMSSVTIVHTPLMETEDTIGPYTVTAEIFSTDPPLDAQNLWLKYGYAGSITDSVLLQPTGNTDEFSTDIPGGFSDVTIVYYLSATDASMEVVTHPAEAPANLHAFYVGADVEAPVVTHSPLTDKPLIVWPATVRAQVTDNLGVSSVEVNYLIDGGNAGSFALAAVGDDWYEGTFDFDATAISIGSTIEYRVVATDAATVPNITNDPESGFHSFEIIDTKGVVLVVDDDPETKFVSDEKGSYVREFPNGKDAASSMADILTEKGYVVEVVDMATAVSTDFEPYTLIIHSSGGNTTSADNAAYRQKLIDYLLGSVDSKLIIEGGEIGYDYRDDTSGFAEHVLHITGWTGDVSGDMNKVAAFSGHPLLNSPNLLPETIELVDPSFGDQDSSPLTDDAFAVYEPEDPGNAGVSFFDHTPNPASGQVVYFAFNAAVANADKFAMLLENAADYLHAQEAPPTGGIEITVDLTDTEDDSGASVNITGPLTAVELTTDASGMVSLSELYDGTYFVAVSKAGYNPLVINDTLVIVDGSTATGSYSLDANSVDTKIMGTVSLTEGGAADGAAVSILGQSLADTTDDTGAYMIDGITAGDITVRFSLSGYAPVVLDTTIANGETLTLDVSLDPSPGIVLVVDDDPETKFVSDEKGSYVRSFPNNKDASGSITEILSNLGYLVDVVDMATAVTTDFSAYTLVIHSSGGNTTTIDNADYRQKLVDYVSASFDNKLIVEGGEVGFDWDEEDAAFAANVLHAHDWTTDNAGTLNAVADYTSHPVMTTPNVLSGTLELAYNGWGDQDGMVINEDAFVVFDPASKPGEAGINIFDPTPNPTSGQIVYLAFNAAVADAEKFAALLENTAAYLHAFEAPPTGSLEVTVDLLDNNNNSGATVEITGPGFSVTELTDSLGVLSYESLYDGTYSVQVSKAGYNPEMITDEVVIADGAGESRTYELSPNTADVTGIVTSSALGAVENVLVSIAEQGLSTTTDNTGAYALSGVSPGNIVITYEFVDHHTETVEATIANDETLEIDVELHPDLGSSPSISLEEVDGGIMITWAMVTAGAFSDDFESGNFDTNGWDVVIGPGTPGTDGPNPFWHVLNSSSLALEGEYLAFADWGYTINSWIKTPAIGVDENSVLSFNWNSSYYWSVDPNDNQDMFVKVSTDDGSSWETIWTYGDIGVWENFVWYNTEIPLGDYAGQEVMVAFNIVGDDAATNALENVSIYTATEKFNDSRTIAYARPAGVIEENARSYRGTFSLNQQKLDMMHFNIYRGHGSSDDMVHLVEMHEDSTWYMDDTTIDGDTYYYTVEAVYDLGSVMSDTVFVMFVSVGENGNLIPTAYNLKQNYPNPFNPTTTIAYDLPRNSDVTFNIYSVTGQLVRTLNQGSVAAGRHSVVWDGKDFNGNQLASGIYFYQIKAGSFNKTMKMMLVK
jgi:hypothetical protein